MADAYVRPKVGPASPEVRRRMMEQQRKEAIAEAKEGRYVAKPVAKPVTRGTELARGILSVVGGGKARYEAIETAVDEATGDNDRRRRNQSTDSNN